MAQNEEAYPPPIPVDDPDPFACCAFCASEAIDTQNSSEDGRVYLSTESHVDHGITEYSQTNANCEVQFGLAYVERLDAVIIAVKDCPKTYMKMRDNPAALVPHLPISPILGWLRKGKYVIVAGRGNAASVMGVVRVLVSCVKGHPVFRKYWAEWEDHFFILTDFEVPTLQQMTPVEIRPFQLGGVRLHPYQADSQLALELSHPSLWFVQCLRQVYQENDNRESEELPDRVIFAQCRVRFQNGGQISSNDDVKDLHDDSDAGRGRQTFIQMFRNKFRKRKAFSVRYPSAKDDIPRVENEALLTSAMSPSDFLEESVEETQLRVDQSFENSITVIQLQQQHSSKELRPELPVSLYFDTKLDDVVVLKTVWSTSYRVRRAKMERVSPQQAAWLVVPLTSVEGELSRQLNEILEPFREELASAKKRIEAIIDQQQQSNQMLLEKKRMARDAVNTALAQVSKRNLDHHEEDRKRPGLIHATNAADRQAEAFVGSGNGIGKRIAGFFTIASLWFQSAFQEEQHWLNGAARGGIGASLFQFELGEEREIWVQSLQRRFDMTISDDPSWLLLCEIVHEYLATRAARFPIHNLETAEEKEQPVERAELWDLVSAGDYSEVSDAFLQIEQHMNETSILDYFRAQVRKKMTELKLRWMGGADEEAGEKMDTFVETLLEKKMRAMSCAYQIYRLLSRQKIICVYGTKCAGKTTFCNYFGHPSQFGDDRCSYYPHPHELPGDFVLVDFPHYAADRADCALLSDFRNCVCDIIVLVFNAREPGTDVQQMIYDEAINQFGPERVIVLFNRCDTVIVERQERLAMDDLKEAGFADDSDEDDDEDDDSSGTTIWPKIRFENHKNLCAVNLMGARRAESEEWIRNVLFTCMTELDFRQFEDLFAEYYDEFPSRHKKKLRTRKRLKRILETEWKILKFHSVFEFLKMTLRGCDEDWDALYEHCKVHTAKVRSDDQEQQV